MLKSGFRTSQFNRDYKSLKKKHFQMALIDDAIVCLFKQNVQLLKTKYKDHALKGEWAGYREIHIAGDWLLIYKINKDELELVLTRTGSHDELL